MTTGSILPEPQIPNKDRWGTASGPSFYPFVRSIGGVSLFDFLGFNEITYNQQFPNSMWRTFVPCFGKWDEAIWIEINRTAIVDNFVDGKTVLDRWKQRDELGRKIMPLIEAAHIGPIPISAFHRVYKFSKREQEFRPLPTRFGQIA